MCEKISIHLSLWGRRSGDLSVSLQLSPHGYSALCSHCLDFLWLWHFISVEVPSTTWVLLNCTMVLQFPSGKAGATVKLSCCCCCCSLISQESLYFAAWHAMSLLLQLPTTCPFIWCFKEKINISFIEAEIELVFKWTCNSSTLSLF